MNDKIIGILAGMGPRSTAPFIDLLVDECQLQYGAKYDEEFPKMIIYSLPTPFYIDKPINHQIMQKTIMEGLQKLEYSGVDFIAMPCNSAHIYFSELKKTIKIPLLNMVEETVKKLPANSQRVTLFATSSTFESNIYQKSIEEAHHQFIFKASWQEKINDLIKNIKINRDNPENLLIWNELIKEVKKQSIENIIIACTDLNAVLKNRESTINIIDSSKSLAEQVVSKYLEYK